MPAPRCEQCDGRGPHFCAPRVDRVAQVFAQLLRHTKGRWARQPFALAPWQLEGVVAPLFGAVEWDAAASCYVRTHRVAWVELARKNGKSELLAGIALVLMVADDEEGAEVYGAAVDRDQAAIVWQVAERMVALSPLLSRRLKIYKQSKRIVDERTGSYYQVLAGDALGNLGLNPHGVVFDEVHAQKAPDLWNALRTSMGTRTQAMMVAATTAGNDPSSFAATEHAYSAQVAEDPSLDRRRLVFMRNTPPEADPWDESGWAYANPALGSFLSIEALRDESVEARRAPGKENAFRQFRLNQWVRSSTRWLSMDAWDASAGLVDEEALAGRRCYGGLDLANTADLTALAWAFPDDDGSVAVIWRHFIPEGRLAGLDARTGGMASAWARQGYLTTTPGNVLDHSAVQAQVDRDAHTFDVVGLAYDRWGMAQLRNDLADAGLVVVDMGQGFSSMSPPAKEFERLVLAGQLRHGGNPVARWQAGHVVVRQDPAGNIKPDKERSHEKVDGIVAAVMALDRVTRSGTPRRSAYEGGNGLEVM
jgi:phage terminase large subunit-like protein